MRNDCLEISIDHDKATGKMLYIQCFGIMKWFHSRQGIRDRHERMFETVIIAII
jgi:hypothetical protein